MNNAQQQHFITGQDFCVGRLEGATSIQATSLSQDQFEKVLGIDTLEVLTVKDSNLKSIPVNLRCTGLKHLTVKESSLEEAEGLKGLRFLQTLDLSHNLLPTSDFLPPGLKEVNLSHNRIKRLPKSVEVFRQTRVLEVAGNVIDYIPASLGRLWDLETLDVSHNKIARFPLYLERARSIATIKTAGNPGRPGPGLAGACC